MPRILALLARPTLLLVAASWAAVPVWAQLTGSMSVGASVTTFVGETTLDYTLKPGWTGGFGIGYEFAYGISVRPELFYIAKGGNAKATRAELEQLLGITGTDPDDTVRDVSLRREVTYLEVPVLLVYRRHTNWNFHPRVFAGPSFGYKLASRIHFRTETGGEQSDTDRSIRQSDFGFVVGGGAEFDVYGERLTLEVRALLGRANIRNGDPAVRNAGVLLLLGMVF